MAKAEEYLLLLNVWYYSGLSDYEEHTGNLADCERLAHEAMRRPGASQSRCTAYKFGSGEVVNALNCGKYPGWRHGDFTDRADAETLAEKLNFEWGV